MLFHASFGAAKNCASCKCLGIANTILTHLFLHTTSYVSVVRVFSTNLTYDLSTIEKSSTFPGVVGLDRTVLLSPADILTISVPYRMLLIFDSHFVFRVSVPHADVITEDATRRFIRDLFDSSSDRLSLTRLRVCILVFYQENSLVVLNVSLPHHKGFG